MSDRDNKALENDLVEESLVEEVSIDALRPEPFGALLYHFATRKLSFLKNTTIVAVVKALPDHPDVRSALRAQGIEDDAAPQYARALSTLADSHMIVPV
eukprot:gene24901-29885_t